MGPSGGVGGAAAYPQNSQATVALIRDILGFVCCQLLAPVAWYVGQQELDNIEAARVPSDDEGMARAGQVLGIPGAGAGGRAGGSLPGEDRRRTPRHLRGAASASRRRCGPATQARPRTDPGPTQARPGSGTGPGPTAVVSTAPRSRRHESVPRRCMRLPATRRDRMPTSVRPRRHPRRDTIETLPRSLADGEATTTPRRPDGELRPVGTRPPHGSLPTDAQAPDRAANAAGPPTSAPIIRPSLHGDGTSVRPRDLHDVRDAGPVSGDPGVRAARRPRRFARARVGGDGRREAPIGDPTPLVPDDDAVPLEEDAR